MECSRVPERHTLWHREAEALVKQAVKVHMHSLASRAIQQNVLTMAITQAQNVAVYRNERP